MEDDVIRALEAVAADVRRLPYLDNCFDAIVSNSTLGHFSTKNEIVTSLSELRRVLRRGGTLVLTLDNKSNPVVAFAMRCPSSGLTGPALYPIMRGSLRSSRCAQNSRMIGL